MNYDRSIKLKARWICRLWLILGLIAPFYVKAIDNPDAPDYLTDFASRANPYADALANAKNISETATAAGKYHDFLDNELNKSYKQLMSKLDANSQSRLRDSQRAWLKFSQAEVRFIDENWNSAEFGSSSALSKAEYRNALIKARIETLLGYLKNYPNP